MKRLARNRTRTLVVGVCCATLALTAGACGSGDGGGDGGSASGFGSEVKVLSVTDLTGAAAFAGTEQVRGAELAIEEMNDQKLLGSARIVLEKKDAASNAQTAAGHTSAGVSDKSIAALLGTVNSTESVAVAPIVQRGKLPTVFTQSGSPGVLLGDYTFRATPTQESRVPMTVDYLKGKGIKTVSIIYNKTSPSTQEIAEQLLPKLLKEADIQLLSTTAVLATTQDFAAPVAKALKEGPDAVFLNVVGAANPTAMKQLRQGGFDGMVVGNSSAGGGNLLPAGQAGAGMVYTNDFFHEDPYPSVQKFVKAYNAKYGTEKLPSNYAAEGYDATWMIGRALKAAGSADREAVQDGLDEIAEDGFDGALGKVTFSERDMQNAGVLLGWDGKKESIIPTP